MFNCLFECFSVLDGCFQKKLGLLKVLCSEFSRRFIFVDLQNRFAKRISKSELSIFNEVLIKITDEFVMGIHMDSGI